MQGRIEGMTREKLEALAKDRRNIVMEAVHDNVFEPWDNRKVEGIVEEMKRRTLEMEEEGKEEILERAKESHPDFVRLHPVLAAKLCDPDIVKNPSHMQVVDFMVRTQASLQGNAITKDEAMQKVADFALESLAKQAKTEKEERIVEI